MLQWCANTAATFAGRALGWIWSGWGAAAGLLIGVALWEAASAWYDPMILPGPRVTLLALGERLHTGELGSALGITVFRALAGFAAAALVGFTLGGLAGLSPTASLLARPYVTVLLGTPPIAWLVLALLWFGSGSGTPIFTVFVACLPLLFSCALQGTRTLDGAIKRLASAFQLPLGMRIRDVYMPHMVSYLVPGIVTALGVSWKVAIMAELLASSDGVGAALAITRSQLDTAGTLAWLTASVVILLAVEYLLLEPIKQRTEQWRTL